MPQSRFASFALALPLYRVFEYRLDSALPAIPGTRYQLPFANRTKTGVLLADNTTSDYDPDKIRPVLEQLDEHAVLDAHLLDLARWMADYYLQPLGEVVFQCLPAYLRGNQSHSPARVKVWRLADTDEESIESLSARSPRQYEICRALQDQAAGLTAADLKAINSNWHAAVKSLEGKGMIEWAWQEQAYLPPEPVLPDLSPEQSSAVESIQGDFDQFRVHLLDGITGSGKTEIYLRLIAARIAAGFQVIYLVPEIGLTNQLIERIQERFGECFVTSHSGLTDLQRYRAWDRFRRGEVSIMLGTRSSLFSQCPNLGLIVIDEEHDTSYRQDDGVRYHARDVAIKRAQMLDIPVLLGSATPSLESISNCEREHYRRYRLDRRPTRFPPPSIALQDVRKSSLEFGCSMETLQRIDHHLEQGGQVLIYLNRRGYAPVVMCHDCGWQAVCVNCDSRLTLHQSVNALVCHHCGLRRELPERCPECDNPEVKHHGIGTERLEQGLARRFPQVPVLRVDRDVIATRDAFRQRLEQLQSGEPCILIGTQMIAKGHDYPAITLSVILDSDQALFSASYRASERLAQTLFQVSGRSGRGDRPGEAIVQTRFPDQPLMQNLAKLPYRQIVDNLLDERRLLGLPPYSRVVIFRADAAELKMAMQQLESIRGVLDRLQQGGTIKCIGPIPALMTRRIGRYRAQLALISADYPALRNLLHQAMPQIEALPGTNQSNWTIDVDAHDL